MTLYFYTAKMPCLQEKTKGARHAHSSIHPPPHRAQRPASFPDLADLARRLRTAAARTGPAICAPRRRG